MLQGNSNSKQFDSNAFLKYREYITQSVEAYRQAREKYKLSDGHSETIETLARPFIKGHFTLAIVGEMSAGKSTFINALLQNRNLLATGFGQTTSTITEIQHAEEARYEVLFANNEVRSYDSPDELRKHMALDEGFVDLPIKQINELIVDGRDIDYILSQRDYLEKCSGKTLDERLLRSYVAEHNRSNIPCRVMIHTPFKPDFLGWKIIDTPGVAATGGVDAETYKLLDSKGKNGLNNTVDAVIFVNSARKGIEEAPFRLFVKETIEKLPNAVKERLFLVRTRGADRDYLRAKEKQDQEAKKLFAETLGIEEERLIVVDSLTQLLLDYVDMEKIDIANLDSDIPASWSEELWDAATDIVRDAEKEAKKKGLDPKKVESLEIILKGWSNFEHLNTILNSFVAKEKSRIYHEILGKIREDYEIEIKNNQELVQNINQYLGNLEGLRDALARNEAKAEEVNEEMNIVLSDLGRKYGRLYIERYFRPIGVVVFDEDAGINSMKATFRKSMSEVNDGCRRLFREISRDLEKQYKGFLNTSALTMPNIDFDSLGTQAVESAWHDKVVGYEKKVVESEGFFGEFLRFITLETFGYEEVDDKSKPITKRHFDREVAKQTFRNYAMKQFTEALGKIKHLVAERVDELGRRIQGKLEVEVAKLKKRNEELQRRCQKQEDQIKVIEENKRANDELEGLIANINTIITIK